MCPLNGLCAIIAASRKVNGKIEYAIIVNQDIIAMFEMKISLNSAYITGS